MATKTLRVPTGSVAAELMFYMPPKDGSEAYYYINMEPPAGRTVTNVRMEGHVVTVSDLRGKESEFNLDKNGFQVLNGIQSEEKDFLDDEQIERVYYPEVEKLLTENVPGVHRVVIFNHTIRRASARRPVFLAHIDQTAKSAPSRVQLHAPDDAEKLLQGRYRIINVWRPINGPVYNNHLGLADSSTVNDDDLLALKRISPDRVGETAGLVYNADQRWHYLSGMTNDERLLFKIFDSDDHVGKWGRVPHTAFKDSRSPPEAPLRESIEVRALLFG